MAIRRGFWLRLRGDRQQHQWMHNTSWHAHRGYTAHNHRQCTFSILQECRHEGLQIRSLWYVMKQSFMHRSCFRVTSFPCARFERSTVSLTCVAVLPQCHGRLLVPTLRSLYDSRSREHMISVQPRVIALCPPCKFTITTSVQGRTGEACTICASPMLRSTS